jgi:uncharacterized membrane protein
MDLNRSLSISLREGVLIGTAISILGLLIWSSEGFPNINALSNVTILEVIQSGLGGSAAGLVGIGVIILIATPVLRVGLSVLYFAHEKDRKYIAITALVFGMLLFALFSGRAA